MRDISVRFYEGPDGSPRLEVKCGGHTHTCSEHEDIAVDDEFLISTLMRYQSYWWLNKQRPTAETANAAKA